MSFDRKLYKGKKVLLTGHTGFKGTWISVMLIKLGATVIGFSTCTKKDLSLFQLSGIEKQIIHIKGDIRNFRHLLEVFRTYKPEIVIHMAAQPIVKESYRNPIETYHVNVMGTVNVCEAVRRTESVRSFINVTTDKVYENKEWIWGYRENDILDGYDPYSNSKSCSELVTHSFKSAFYSAKDIAVSTVRAGNVIGGGDFSQDRIIPDCVKAMLNREDIIVRNPLSIRPYQHVLEPIYVYLMIAIKQLEDKSYQSWYNVGPNEEDCFQTFKLVELFLKKWESDLKWINKSDDGPHEATFLKLDCSKLKTKFNWKPHWQLEIAVEKVVEWSKAWFDGGNIRNIMDKQIEEFLGE